MIAFLTLGELGVLGANPFRGGAENRAKGAKGAKVKGKKDEEIARVVVDWAFALGRVILDLSLYLPPPSLYLPPPDLSLYLPPPASGFRCRWAH